MPRPLHQPIVIDTYFHLIYSKDDAVTDFDNWYQDQVRVTSLGSMPMMHQRHILTFMKVESVE